jgi:exodeoxyribonuclease VII large subunit
VGSNFFDFREQLFRANRPPRREDPTPQPASPSRPEPLTVSQLTQQIERALKGGLPAVILVRGECSNCKPHASSGHFYFTLKDASACIDCVMYRDDFRTLAFAPNDGIEMLATGRVAVYGQRGRYQLYCTRLEPLGRGALELAFQQMRAKLEREGLFDPENKKPLPRYPIRIGLVTGRATAALQDILKVLRRFPWLRVKLFDVPVQGKGAAAKIAATLRKLSDRPDIDVILLARGGGSLEDLWEFNEEAVARAVAGCAIPIITGIGHEIDTSIADLAADFHAHTPTEAAQVATAHWRSAAEDLTDLALRLRRATAAMLELARHRLQSIQRHETFRRPLDRVNQLRQFLDDRERALSSAMSDRLRNAFDNLRDSEDRLQRRRPSILIARLRERLVTSDQFLRAATMRRLRRAHGKLASADARLATRHPTHRLRLADQRLHMLDERLRCGILLQRQRFAARLDSLERELTALSPSSVLRRGFSMTLIKRSGAILRSASQIQGGEKLITKLAEGEIESIADDPKQPKLFDH